MAKSEPIRIGLVGIGRAGGAMHCKELEGRERQFRIVAACDVMPDRLDEMAKTYGCNTYTDIKDLIADPDVELVDIATRSIDHCPQAMLALKAGKSVFLEKPISLTYAEARRLQAAEARSASKLYVRHNRRYDPTLQHVREIVDSKLLGDVYEIKMRVLGFNRRDDWQTLLKFGGGQLLNWGPHLVDAGLQLMQSEPKRVWSDLKRIAAAGDAEDHVKIIMQDAKGRVVDVQISGAAAVTEPNYTLLGSRGAAVVQDGKIKLRYLDPRRKRSSRRANPNTPPTNGYGSQDKLVWIEKEIPIGPKKKMAFTMIWDDLYRAIRKGAKFPVTTDQAVAVMKVLSDARKGTSFQIPKPRRKK